MCCEPVEYIGRNGGSSGEIGDPDDDGDGQCIQHHDEDPVQSRIQTAFTFVFTSPEKKRNSHGDHGKNTGSDQRHKSECNRLEDDPPKRRRRVRELRTGSLCYCHRAFSQGKFKRFLFRWQTGSPVTNLPFHCCAHNGCRYFQSDLLNKHTCSPERTYIHTKQGIVLPGRRGFHPDVFFQVHTLGKFKRKAGWLRSVFIRSQVIHVPWGTQ